MTSAPSSSFVRRHPKLRGGLAAGVAGLGLLTLAGCALDQAHAEVATTTTETGTNDTSTTDATSSAPGTYADGTYTADTTYQAPSGVESVSVTIALVDGVVTAVTATGDATDHEARQFQERFASGVSSAVVGKDIADLSVSRVSGASLTSNGFNTALEQIRSEALA